MEGYAVYSGIVAKDGKGHLIKEYFLEIAKEMESIDGCRTYIVGEDTKKAEAIYVFEVWDSKESHDESLKMPIYQELREKARSLILTVRNLPAINLVGGKQS